MRFLRKQPCPKDEFEQPTSVQQEMQELPVSPFTGEEYDPEWGYLFTGGRPLMRAPKANLEIISKVWK